MTNAKLVLALAGVLIWAHGTRISHPGVQWLGIALVAIGFLLRFAGPRRQPPAE